MKNLIAFLLVIVMIFSLCACGSSSKSKSIPIEVDDVKTALDGLGGELDIETFDDTVSSFTFVINDFVYTSDDFDSDIEECKTDMNDAFFALISNGKTSQLPYKALTGSKAILAFICIESIFDKETDDLNVLVEKSLRVICDGDLSQHNGWTISAEIDEDNTSLIYSVVSK